MTRGFILALQFLTRLPVPAVHDFVPADLSRSAAWFPLVGAIVGAICAALLAAGNLVDPWLGALLAALGWIWVTGALHVDGLADLADALGAAHRDPARFLQVLRDPHVGSFGVVAIVAIVVSKLVLLSVLIRHSDGAWLVLPLLAAWARLGAIAWSAWLPPLSPGTAERFAWHISGRTFVAWTAVLTALSAWFAPAMLFGPVAIAAWGYYLKRKLGGVTGDCLGAGIELTEVALLLICVIGTALSGAGVISA